MSAVRRLNVQLRGTGDRAMVFAHGFGCDQRMWRYVAPHFESEFVTVLFDHMGSGQSDFSAYSPDRYASLRDYARDLVELGGEVPFEDAVLVGHSCGGMIGLLASLEAPGMFENLVLVSASPRYINDSDYEGGFTQPQVDGLLKQLRADYDGWSRNMAPVFMGNRDRPELARELEQSFLRNDPVHAAEFGEAIFNSDWRKELSTVRSECLIVQSEHDPVVPSAVARYMGAHIRNCRSVTITSDGHFPHLSAPERLVTVIRQFVGVASRSPGRPLSRPEWPIPKGGVLRLSESSWSQHAAPLSDPREREELEDHLLKRVGELSAHLGRYDMHALTIARWLDDQPHGIVSRPPANVRTRGAVIEELLTRHGRTPGELAQFQAINAELIEVLDRHEISAKNCAVIPAFDMAAALPLPANPRDWYEYTSASDQELLFFIDSIERDILSVASLYIRLSNYALMLRGP